MNDFTSAYLKKRKEQLGVEDVESVLRSGEAAKITTQQKVASLKTQPITPTISPLRPITTRSFKPAAVTTPVTSAVDKYNSLKNNSDFKKYSSQGAAKKNLSYKDVEKTWEVFGTDKREDKIANIVTYSRDNADKLLEAEADRRQVAGSYLYKYMSDDEVSIYNYLLAKSGKTEAKKYLDTIEEELNQRYGKELGQKVSNTKGVGGAALKGLFSVGSGVDQWVSGVKQLTTEERLPTSATQVASQTVQEDLGTVGKYLYGAGTTVGNQLPSIALTMLGSGIAGIAGAGTKAVGTVSKLTSGLSMGASAAGNTYNEAMASAEAEGYTKDQAKLYAGLVGASEFALGSLLGGVGNVTGLSDDILLAKVAGIDNAFARLALSGVIRIGNEEVEEIGQLWLEPALKTLILKTDFEAPTWQEHVETAIVTALATGIMEGGGVVKTEINYGRYGEDLLKTHSEGDLIGEVLANTPAKSKVHKLAEQLGRDYAANKVVKPTDLGRMYVLYQAEVNPVVKTTVETTTDKSETTTDKAEATTDTTAEELQPKTRKADAKTEVLSEMAKSEDADTANYAVSQMAHTEETVVSPIAQTLMNSGMKAADAVEQADLIMKVQSGQKLTKSEMEKLRLANESVRNEFNKATGSEVTDGQARNASQKRQVIRSAAEVAKAKSDTAAAEKAREAAVATEKATAEAAQNARAQKAQADLHNAATAYAADMMAKAVAQAETQAAEPSIEFEDGTTQTQSEFVEGYRSQHPDASVEEALDMFHRNEQYNQMGQKIPGTAPTAAKDTKPATKTEKKSSGKGKRHSVGDKRDVEVDQYGRTEAGRAKERELTLKKLNTIAGKSGVKVEVRDPDGVDLAEDDNGYYDASTKTIVLNSKKATNQFAMTYYFVHELTHHGQAKDGDVEKGLTHDIIEAMKSEVLLGKEAVDKLIAKTRTAYENNYRKNNRDLSLLDKPNFIEDEVACNFMMEAIRDRSMLDKLAGVTTKPHMSLIERVRAFIKGEKQTAPGVAEANRLVERLQQSLARETEKATGAVKGTTGDTKRQSIDTLVEAVGLTYEKGEGGVTILRNAQGAAVGNVSVNQVRNSPLGAVIQSAVNGNIISVEDADKQVEFFSGLFNMMLETNDIDLIWAVSSAIGFNPVEAGTRDRSMADTPKSKSRFTAYTSNSDPQYSTTVDFTTICLKTKAIIDVMSETMVRLERGLSETEIIDIVYKEVYEAGEPVPCPVCYVFSRWVGLGGLFDKMWNNQQKYANYSTDRLWDAVTRLEKDIAEIQSRNDVKRAKAISTLYKDMSNRQNALRDKDTKHRTAGSEPLTAEERTELDSLNADMEILDDWAWLTKVRLDPDYKPVPADILFDINKGKEFAEQYPKSWTYRTTRGPAMGKAATPYEAEHLGQILRGAGMNKSSIKENLGDQTKNPFLKAKTGKLSKAANTVLDKSRNKVKAQNLLNGQRFQSTSDFRFEYALDYLLALTEMQALGSKIQMYTKVPESVRMMASCGAEVNCSLMPLGVGYDENGNLTFSSVTGMNPEDAFNLSTEFDNVQPIMVGTSDKHIQLCMADDRITFIIPYHASGAGEARYAALMDIVGERVESRDDYSLYQTDHEIADATPEQKAARDLRKRILTGKADTLTSYEASVLKGNTVLHELYKRFYGKNADGVAEAIDPKYLAPAQRESATSQDNECFGVKLTSEQASTIMPFEYWDRTLTRDQADENSRAFAEYCASLGMYPRFSGYDSKGFYRPEKDFSKTPGYWKMLGDRKLYNNDGTYHEQQTINITNFDASYLTREESVKGIVQPSQMNDPEAVSRITDKVVERLRYSVSEEAEETSDSNIRYSIREKEPPKKTGVAYKVFLAKDGELYPPMVANPGGAGTPVGVWLDADIGKSAPPSKTGRPQVQGGGKGTNSGKISLAFRPGWHLGDIPLAKQFAQLNPETGKKELFPANFVWAECEYAMDEDYQEEAMSYGYTENGKFRHSYAGLPRLPEDGYYRYRTNPNPDTVPWIITGAMRVKRILTDAETDAICRENGVEPMARKGGPIDLAEFGLTAGEVVEPTEKRFSISEDPGYAPVFYSKMAQVVDGVKQEKLGAASVVSMLKGKGVKNEEIKWSGIEAWLEGKKSVTKQELLDFIAANELQIEEQERTSAIQYTDEQRAELERLDAENDKLFDQISDNWYALFNDGIPFEILGSRNMYDRASRKLDARGKGATPEARAIREAIRAHDRNELLMETIRDKAKEQHNGTKWGDYTLEGGENYREYLFKMPGSEYSNQAMKAHWGSNNTGVIAHARVQDFETDNGKMLFIEEIQSDWHNAGHADGYATDETAARLKEANRVLDETARVRDAAGDAYFKAERAQSKALMADYDDLWEQRYKAATLKLSEEKIKYDQATDQYDKAAAEVEKLKGLVPDAPFSKTYHEFVLKNLIRRAAEEGYDSIGWTTAQQQEDRWSEDYAEGYRIEYDQDIPKFLNKYGRQWGAKVERVALPGTGSPSTLARDLEGLNPYDEDDIRQMLHIYLEDADPDFRDRDVATDVSVIENPDTGEIELSVTASDIDTWETWSMTSSALERVQRSGGEGEVDTVWSMPITDAMKQSVLYEGQPRYSISPETGYEEGSTEDKVMKLLKAGSVDDAIKHLETWAQEIQDGTRDADATEQTLKNALFAHKPVTSEEAAKNRAKLDALIQKYGEIKPGEKRARPVFIPNKVNDYTAVSQYARTVAEAKQTPEWFKEQVEQNIANSEAGFTHTIATDKDAMNYIKGRQKVSFEHNLSKWNELVETGKGSGGLGGITKNDIALGEYLYTVAVNAGDVSTATKLVADLASIGTAAGQAVQAMSLLKKLGPAGQMYYLQRTIDRLNNSYQKKIDAGKMSPITVNPDMVQAIFDAKTTEEAQAAMDALLQDVANQVPSTLMEKWNAWRYLAMLGNPRTHIRNLFSNAVFGPVTWLKDIVDATFFQPFVKRENRTKHLGEALLNSAYGISSALTFGKAGVKLDKYIQFADADYAAMEDTLRDGGKHNPADLIRDKRHVFNFKPLDLAAEANSKALDKEDAVYLKIHYVRALSQYLAAQKADVATLESTPDGRNLLAKARSWAVQEAKKATFRDASALANALSRLERSGLAGQLIVGGVMPFKKTPINILKRGAEYSPLGVVNTVKQLTRDKEKAAYTLDALASTVTGTGIMMFGAYLLKEGILRAGGSDDEKERDFEELQGAQSYSIVLDDGTNYTIDWMAPAALPLFVGAECAKVFGQDGELSASDFADMLLLIAEPMFQLSMLDGLNQTLTSAGYSDNPLSAVAASTLTSYFGQAVPTLLGQVARTVDDTRRMTYVDKNEDTIDTLDRTVQYNMTKIPGASKNLAPAALQGEGRCRCPAEVRIEVFQRGQGET